MTLKAKGFCDRCQQCAHGCQASSYPNGCPYGCNSSQDGLEYCGRCGRTARKPSGFCSCGYCCHGRPAPCPDGCSTVGAKTISISARNAASIYAGVPCGNSSLAKLEGLVKMFQKAEVALHMDVEARKTAEKASFSDLIWLNILKRTCGSVQVAHLSQLTACAAVMPGIKEKDEDSQGFCRVCPRGPPGADGAKSGNYLGLISSIIFPFFMRELSNNPKILRFCDASSWSVRDPLKTLLSWKLGHRPQKLKILPAVALCSSLQVLMI